MDELDLFRELRRGVADPSADARRRASARLTAAIEGQLGWGAGIPRLIRRRPGRTVLAFAALAGATAAALFVGAPWKSSPGFLERAEAALTPPAGTVLHAKWELTLSSTDPSCTVTEGPDELWIDQTPPYNYRGIADLPDPAAACGAGGAPVEFGGTRDTGEVLVFVPPNTLSPTELQFLGLVDLGASLRQAISDGRARDEGKTELDGRTVVRIRLTPPTACPAPPCPPPSYAYVDPETFYPVQMDGLPFSLPRPGGGVVQLSSVIRWSTYEYLPGSPANRALADIRAQHPNATGP